MTATTGSNLELQYGWKDAEDGWGEAMNANLLKLDVLTQGVTESISTAPPGSPLFARAYLISGPATGAWAGHAGQLAVWFNAWQFYVPKPGWRFFVKAENVFYYFNGADWAPESTALPGSIIPSIQSRIGVLETQIDPLIKKNAVSITSFDYPIYLDPDGLIENDGFASIYVPKYFGYRRGDVISNSFLPDTIASSLTTHVRKTYAANLGPVLFWLNLSNPSAPTFGGAAFQQEPFSVPQGAEIITIATVLGAAVRSEYAVEMVTRENSKAIPFDMMFPKQILMVEGRKLSIFPDQVFGRSAVGSYHLSLLSARIGARSPFQARSGGDAITLDGTQMGATMKVLATKRAGGQDDQVGIVSTVRVATAAAVVGKTVRALFIGDSITEAIGVPGAAFKRLQEMIGTAPTFLGTMNLGNNSNSLGFTVKGEGRSGRQMASYTNAFNGDMTPLTAGTEASYLGLSLEDQRNKNPFIRPSTGADSSANIKNGYVFDMRFYLNRFSYADPTHVVFALGENDVTANMATMTPDQVGLAILQNAQILYNQTRAALPTAQIFFVWYPRGQINPDTRWERHQRAALRAIIDLLRFTSPQTVLVPAYAMVDRNTAFFTGFGDPEVPTGTMRANVPDPIHPNGMGTEAIGEVIANYIAATAAGA